ncbi:MAG: hypothetical protein U5Q03_13580 [Bacteroidota bacterium]|nr:hypothetical protein [Bacteroidota bacterium]
MESTDIDEPDDFLIAENDIQMTSLKEKLKNNELTIGSWLTIGHHSIVEIMGASRF